MFKAVNTDIHPKMQGISFQGLTPQETQLCDKIYNTVLYYMLLNKRFDIGTVICPRAVVLARGRRPRVDTTARGRIQNELHNYNLFKNISLKEYFI